MSLLSRRKARVEGSREHSGISSHFVAFRRIPLTIDEQCRRESIYSGGAHLYHVPCARKRVQLASRVPCVISTSKDRDGARCATNQTTRSSRPVSLAGPSNGTKASRGLDRVHHLPSSTPDVYRRAGTSSRTRGRTHTHAIRSARPAPYA